jgi:hypothetical protein
VKREWEIGMIPKISLTAAFLLMVAPPMACASNRAATNPPIALQARELPLGMVVAQAAAGAYGAIQPNEGASNNGNESDSDSNENADENQNADPNQADQQNAAGTEQAIPPQVLNGTETDPNSAPQVDQAPQPQPMNPYQ